MLQLNCLMRGSHAIFDFYKADSEKIAKESELKKVLEKVFSDFGYEIIKTLYHQFEPEGVTASIISSKCQLSIHTWPEHGSFTVDFYSAQEKLDMLKLCEAIKKEFLASEYDMRIIRTDDERMAKS